MAWRVLLRVASGALMGVALACMQPAERHADPVTVRFETASPELPDSVDAVTVSGLPADRLGDLEAAGMSSAEWARFLPVQVGEGATSLPPLLGDYTIVDGVVRFVPRFPWVRGQAYQARWLYPSQRREVARASLRLPAATAGPLTRVTAIYPSASRLPENLLRFYVHFSAPMSRKQAATHLRLIGPEGPVELPFVAPEHELWNPTRDRLTLILDPGRIKRGVGPNLEMGPVLSESESFRLEIDAGWLDGSGREMSEAFSKTFDVVAADRSPPRPEAWRLMPPRSASGAVALHFPEPLDHAILLSAIRVIANDGSEVRGRAAVGPGERSWSFVPDEAWPPAPCRLVVDPTLEDLSGNRIGRRFEEPPGSRVGGASAEPMVFEFLVESSPRG